MLRLMVLLLFMNTWVPTCESPTEPSGGSAYDEYDYPVYSPPSIEGRVCEVMSLKPIDGAILAPNPPAPGHTLTSAVSNSLGNYFFEGLYDGNYTIIVEHTAYFPETVTVRTYTDLTTNMNIYMRPSRR
jgi:hypothetical protein